MTGGSKRTSIILIVTVTFCTMVIAAGLPQLKLQPGIAPPAVHNGQVVVQNPEVIEEGFQAITINKFGAVLFALMVSGMILLFLYNLLKNATKQSVLESIRTMLIICIAFTIFALLLLYLPEPSSDTSWYSMAEIPE
ncbi:MAG: hypothetical protein JXA25_15550 [Anaerolineales bacterium]|nr:hypothetical protein [Anaerolineales bacterium]